MTYDNALDGHILNIIQTQEIAEQSDLQDSLKSRGFDIPQATLSRRLKKLNIVKVGGAYKIIQLPATSLPVILNVKISDFGLIVLHTQPGNANGLAVYFDKKYVSFTPQSVEDSGILGTIAGDDTVVLIIKNKTDLQRVIALLRHDFPYLQINL